MCAEVASYRPATDDVDFRGADACGPGGGGTAHCVKTCAALATAAALAEYELEVAEILKRQMARMENCFAFYERCKRKASDCCDH
jgi:hypothetical protein